MCGRLNSTQVGYPLLYRPIAQLSLGKEKGKESYDCVRIYFGALSILSPSVATNYSYANYI